MMKPLTMSLSLAVALSLCGVSKAGLFDNCSTCGLASPQGVKPSHQGVKPSHQGGCGIVTCQPTGAARCCLFSGLGNRLDNFCCKLKAALHPPKCYTYEWVLKKKRVWGHKACTTCGPTRIHPTGQAIPSHQYPSAQGKAAPQHTYQYFRPAAPTIASAPAEMTSVGEEAPPVPEVREATSNGSSSLLLPTPAGN